jgi:3D (Asp-Asp-Asp) domain-containing protein
MRVHLNKNVMIIGLSILLQSGVSAQRAEAAQSQSSKPSSNHPSTTSADTGPKDQLALVSDKAIDKALNKTAIDVNSTATAEHAIAEPRVSVKNPPIEFKVKPSESKMNGRPFSIPEMEALGKPMSFQATAYALRGRTRSGAYVRRGVIAADPRVIPLGSVVQIKTPGYTGVYTVQDTGRKIKGNIVDLWVPSTGEARSFGRRSIKLHVLRLGPNGRPNK